MCPDPRTYTYRRIDSTAKTMMAQTLPDILNSCCATTSLDDLSNSVNSALTHFKKKKKNIYKPLKMLLGNFPTLFQ